MIRRNAFSLIELLVVISVIGILVAIGGYGWSVALARQRDNARKTDMERTKNVLEQYFIENKQYPNFDTKNTSYQAVFSARWQLTSGTIGCAHDSSDNARLTTHYIAEIPSSLKTDISSIDCPSIIANQKDDYLYVAGNNDSTGNLTKWPKSYALLTKLEKINSEDAATATTNPIKDNLNTNFSSYFSIKNGSSTDGTVTPLVPNYMITSAGAK